MSKFCPYIVYFASIYTIFWVNNGDFLLTRIFLYGSLIGALIQFGGNPEMVAIQNPAERLDHAKREIVSARFFEISSEAINLHSGIKEVSP